MSTPSTLVADRYRLVALLGTGGMGVVWQAWDERLRRPVALKMLRSQPELSDADREVATGRAMREARITAGLHHAHAVTVFDVVQHEGQPCIVMQLIESTPLSELLREHGTLTPRETARIGTQVSSALAAAHAMRIVHRDVKPGNILITGDGSALISDFGISHSLGDSTLTATGMMHGTPAYLAPEVARGQASSFASDVFSLGSTLYTMLEGAPPFGADANAIALLHKVARASYPAPRHAGALAPLLREMLSADPKRRPDMKSVASRLSAMYEGTDAAAASALPTVPLGAAAAADAAALAADDAGTADADATVAAGAPQPDAESPPVGATAETDPHGEATAATQRLAEATAETRRLEETSAETQRLAAATAETRRLEETTAETQRLAAATATTQRMDEATATTQRLAGPAVVDAVDRPARKRPAPPPVARPVGSRPSPPPVAPETAAETPPRRGRRFAALVGILLLAGVLLGGGVFLFGQLGRDAGVADGPRESAAPTAAPTTDAAAPSSAEASAPESQAPPTAPDPTPAPATPEQRIVAALTTYYSAMPGDLDRAWPLMTADYQVNHVGGRDAYGAFWGEVADVEIADVSASPPDAAQATLTYTFTDGRVVQEVTAYRLVDEGGVLKIAATEVLSSVEQ